jgi:hypothetical protein
VGSDEGGGGGAFAGGDAGAPGAFDAYVEQSGVHVTVVTVSCAGDCAMVKAVATGGHPPYQFAWDNGSTSAVRQICPTTGARYAVTATDTATSGEFPLPAQTVHVGLGSDVLACPDGGPAAPDASLCAEGTVTPDVLDNAVAYFADGGTFPAGHYTLAYVSGA